MNLIPAIREPIAHQKKSCSIVAQKVSYDLDVYVRKGHSVTGFSFDTGHSVIGISFDTQYLFPHVFDDICFKVINVVIWMFFGSLYNWNFCGFLFFW